MLDVLDLPDIDDRLVAPETPYEILDGELIYVAPSDEPHGFRHADLCAVIGAHRGAGFRVACDLLTRTSKTNDFAPDVSVYPSARDPRTGRRQLEHLAFEVVSTQSLGHAGRKAGKLIARGVRRVFAIDVERERVLEWSVELAGWSVLDPDAVIADVAFAVPLPISALLTTDPADDAVARALVARHHPVIEESRAHDRADAILAVLAARGIAVPAADRARILAEPDRDRLTRWLARAATCARLADVLSEP